MPTSKPWEIAGTPWKTESQFWVWVRGQIRRGWARHPVKHLFIKQNRYKKENAKGRMVWHMDCAICQEKTPMGSIQIDHKLGDSQFTKDEHIEPFIKRMYFVTFDNLQALCIPCHKIKTHADRKGISFYEAFIDKKVVGTMKKPVSVLKEVLKEFGYEYQTPKEANRENIRKIIMLSELGGY